MLASGSSVNFRLGCCSDCCSCCCDGDGKDKIGSASSVVAAAITPCVVEATRAVKALDEDDDDDDDDDDA